MSTQTITMGASDSVAIQQVGGDLTVEGWDRPEVQARGDHVRMEKLQSSIAISCGGDLKVSVSSGARLIITNVGGDVRIQNLTGSVEVALIGGDASLSNLAGQVRLTGPVGGEVHMENVANISMGASDRGVDFDLGDRIRRTVLHASRRAEKQIRRAQAKAEVHLRQAETARWKYNSGPDLSSTPQTGDPVSEEERMTILRMLQEKKITSEQAEKLLAALEGNK